MSVPDDEQDGTASRPGAGRPDPLHELARDELASVVLGEAVDTAIGEHLAACPTCRADIAAYRQVVGLARSSEHRADVTVGPPAQVWDGIAAAVGQSASSAVPTTVPVGPRADETSAGTVVGRSVVPFGRTRRVLLAAAAVVVVAGAGVAGWAVGHDTSGPAAARSSQAVLVAQPGTSGAAHGRAVVHTSADGYSLTVSARGLPAPEGYYEVWLYNPSVGQMVAVGTLGAGARGSFTVPDGIDLRAYHVVDVSAQRYDGDNRHERSVLRGPLSS